MCGAAHSLFSLDLNPEPGTLNPPPRRGIRCEVSAKSMLYQSVSENSRKSWRGGGCGSADLALERNPGSQRLRPHRGDDAHGRFDGGEAVLGGDFRAGAVFDGGDEAVELGAEGFGVADL